MFLTLSSQSFHDNVPVGFLFTFLILLTFYNVRSFSSVTSSVFPLLKIQSQALVSDITHANESDFNYLDRLFWPSPEFQVQNINCPLGYFFCCASGNSNLMYQKKRKKKGIVFPFKLAFLLAFLIMEAELHPVSQIWKVSVILTSPFSSPSKTLSNQITSLQNILQICSFFSFCCDCLGFVISWLSYSNTIQTVLFISKICPSPFSSYLQPDQLMTLLRTFLWFSFL